MQNLISRVMNYVSIFLDIMLLNDFPASRPSPNFSLSAWCRKLAQIRCCEAAWFDDHLQYYTGTQQNSIISSELGTIGIDMMVEHENVGSMKKL